jgi:hypothetical protein
MSKFKQPTKKEIKRCADIISYLFEKDKHRDFENSLHLALSSRLHKKVLVEQVISVAFGFDPF